MKWYELKLLMILKLQHTLSDNLKKLLKLDSGEGKRCENWKSFSVNIKSSGYSTELNIFMLQKLRFGPKIFLANTTKTEAYFFSFQFLSFLFINKHFSHMSFAKASDKKKITKNYSLHKTFSLSVAYVFLCHT